MIAESIKIGVADFGLWVWDGGLYDLEDRLPGLRPVRQIEVSTLGYTVAAAMHS